MDRTSIDPIDHYRTTRAHAGEAMKNGTNAIGIVGVAIAVIALISGLAALASGHAAAGIAALAIAVLARRRPVLAAAHPPQGSRSRTAMARSAFRRAGTTPD